MARDDDQPRFPAWNEKLFQETKARERDLYEHYQAHARALEEHNKHHKESLKRNIEEAGSGASAGDAEYNPFVVFKNFIDDNLNAIRRFPSNITELKARMQQEKEARQKHEVETYRLWTGNTDTPDNAALQRERAAPEQRQAAIDAAVELFKQSKAKNEKTSKGKVDALYKDDESMFGDLDRFANPMLSFGGACYYKPETDDNLPSTASLFRWPVRQPRWLSIDWFKKSVYSPVHLEAHPLASQEGTRWRAAFEDLLCAALDKPMLTREQFGWRPPKGSPQSTYRGPGLDWMLSLQCRGILPPQVPSFYNQRSETKFRMNGQEGSWSILKSPYRPNDVWEEVNDEWQQLVDEINTPAAPAAPAAVEHFSRRQAETEQDMYDQIQDDFQHKHTSPTLRAWHVPTLIGDEFADNIAINGALYDALARNDSAAVGDILDEYESKYGEDLASIDEDLAAMLLNADGHVTREKVEALNKVLRDNDVTKYDFEAYEPFKQLRSRLERAPLDDDEDRDRGLYRARELMERDREALALSARREQEYNDARRQDREEGLQQQREALDLPAEDKPARPSILSQLTTTQTTRLPDGTVTTKVVLKQRFADGREETTESVETRNDQSEQMEQRRHVEEKPKQKGWFWT